MSKSARFGQLAVGMNQYSSAKMVSSLIVMVFFYPF